jgi:hypothetical protein
MAVAGVGEMNILYRRDIRTVDSNILVEHTPLPLHFLEASGSNLCPGTDYPV